MLKLTHLLCLLTCIQVASFNAKAQHLAELSFREQLFETRDQQKHDQLINAAIDKKISTQTIFEAQFLFSIDQANDTTLLTLLDEAKFTALEKKFSPIDSEIFTSLEELQATFYFIRAVDAFSKKNHTNFETYIKQAFWLAPSQAPILTTYIHKFQTRELIKHYKHPANFKLNLQESKDTLHWDTFVKNNKGCLIILYSPWDQQSVNAAPLIEKLSNHPSFHNQKIILHNIETAPEAQKENHSFKSLFDKNLNLTWTIENNTTSLLSLFKVRSLPTCVFFDDKNNIKHIGDIQAFIKQL